MTIIQPITSSQEPQEVHGHALSHHLHPVVEDLSGRGSDDRVDHHKDGGDGNEALSSQQVELHLPLPVSRPTKLCQLLGGV